MISIAMAENDKPMYFSYVSGRDDSKYIDWLILLHCVEESRNKNSISRTLDAPNLNERIRVISVLKFSAATVLHQTYEPLSDFFFTCSLYNYTGRCFQSILELNISHYSVIVVMLSFQTPGVGLLILGEVIAFVVFVRSEKIRDSFENFFILLS